MLAHLRKEEICLQVPCFGPISHIPAPISPSLKSTHSWWPSDGGSSWFGRQILLSLWCPHRHLGNLCWTTNNQSLPPTQLLQNHHICSLNLPHPSSLQVFAIAIAKSLHHRQDCQQFLLLQISKIARSKDGEDGLQRSLRIAPSHDVLHRSPSSPSDVVDSSKNGKFFPFLQLSFSFYSKSIFLPRQKDREKGRGFSFI